MPRPLRIEYPGAMYHVMNRGDHRDNIFKSDNDRRLFLSTLDEVCVKADWEVHAWCLMRNHFHLVLETPRANLVAGMKWLLGIYTKRFNIHHKLCGHLFAGRYKALIVDGSGNGYLRAVCDYVHLNPVRAKLLRAAQPIESFPWSSYGAYLAGPQSRPTWLRVDRLLGEHGIQKDSAAGRREFAKRMELRRLEEARADYGPMRRGWYLGSEEFARELIATAVGRVGPSHYSARRQETEQERGERIVREELRRIGWREKDLLLQPKGAKPKVAAAKRLRKETTLTLRWIAERLQMGSWTYVSNLLSQERNKPKATLCK